MAYSFHIKRRNGESKVMMIISSSALYHHDGLYLRGVPAVRSFLYFGGRARDTHRGRRIIYYSAAILNEAASRPAVGGRKCSHVPYRRK